MDRGPVEPREESPEPTARPRRHLEAEERLAVLPELPERRLPIGQLRQVTLDPASQHRMPRIETRQSAARPGPVPSPGIPCRPGGAVAMTPAGEELELGHEPVVLPEPERVGHGVVGQRGIQDQVVGGEDVRVGVLGEQELARVGDEAVERVRPAVSGEAGGVGHAPIGKEEHDPREPAPVESPQRWDVVRVGVVEHDDQARRMRHHRLNARPGYHAPPTARRVNARSASGDDPGDRLPSIDGLRGRGKNGAVGRAAADARRRVKDQARVVIIGGGIAGCSIAYHLARKGWTDVLLLDKGELTSGSTWHAAGMVTHFHTSPTIMRMRAVLDPPLPEPPGGAGLARALARGREPPRRLEPGPVALPPAAGRDRARPRARRGHDLAGRGAPPVSRSCLPTTSTGRCTCPGDGWIDPSGSTTELARRARALGVAVETGVRVTGIERSPDGAIAGVATDRGRVRAEIVINAAGMWGRQVAAMAGVSLPITPLVHQHLATKPIPGHELPRQTPVPPRPGEPRLPPRGGRRLPDRRLRAGAGGVVGGRRAVGLHAAAPPVGLGALRRDHGGRDPPRADPRPGGDGPSHERARGHHPGQPAAPGAGAGRARVLGGGRALAHGIRRRGARSATSSRNGSSRASRRTTSAR